MNAPDRARRVADNVELARLAARGDGFVIDPFNRRWHTARCSSLQRMTTGEPKWHAPTLAAASAYFEHRSATAPTARPINACPSCRPTGGRTASATTHTVAGPSVARHATSPPDPPDPTPARRSSWRFSVTDPSPWTAIVPAAPTEETKLAYWNVAIPQLAAATGSVPAPCVVVCRVSSPGTARAPAGPRGRAKALLDALHDDRRSGPMYRDLGARAPLRDDHPSEVHGLAVEVIPGITSTEYLLGSTLVIAGELLATIPVDVEAPNDIAGTPGERDRIAASRRAFGVAVRTAFASHGRFSSQPSALVIRHQPQRDEDNTWATWTAAVCGTQPHRAGSWSSGAPLRGWMPTAIASVADRTLATALEYELWA